MKSVVLVVSVSVAAAVDISAAQTVLMYDFDSSNDPIGSGAVGPGHADGTISPLDTTWLHVTPTFTPLGLSWGQDIAPNGGTVTWGFAYRSDITFTPPSGSVFDNDVLGDSIRTPFNDHAFGVKISIPAGRYAIYVTADSDISRSHTMRIYSGAVMEDASATSYVGLQSVTLNNSSLAGFVLGENYARFEVTVENGEGITVISHNTIPGGEAVLSSLQVVSLDNASVPEASTWASGCGLLGMMWLARSRARSNR